MWEETPQPGLQSPPWPSLAHSPSSSTHASTFSAASSCPPPLIPLLESSLSPAPAPLPTTPLHQAGLLTSTLTPVQLTLPQWYSPPVPSEPCLWHHTLTPVVTFSWPYRARKVWPQTSCSHIIPRAPKASPPNVHFLRQQWIFGYFLSVSPILSWPQEFPRPGDQSQGRLRWPQSIRCPAHQHQFCVVKCCTLGLELPELLKAMAFLGTEPALAHPRSWRATCITHKMVPRAILPSLASPMVSSLAVIMDWHANKLLFWSRLCFVEGLPGDTGGIESACQCRRCERRGSTIPGLGRSPGVGNGTPHQYSCLRNSMDRGDWWATGHGVAKSQTYLSIVLSKRAIVIETSQSCHGISRQHMGAVKS